MPYCRLWICRGLACAGIVGLVLASAPATWAADDLTTIRDKLRADYAAALDELAGWCDEQGLDEPARKTRELSDPGDPFTLYFPILPTEEGAGDPGRDAPAEVRDWNKRLRKLRTDQADALFRLARQAIRQQRSSLAFELVLQTVRQNPDHAAARSLLGYQKYRGEWHTQYAVRMLRSGHVWDDRFGWLPKAHLARYESGERLVNGRWIEAAEDAAARGAIENGWQIETEHYHILTNHSLTEGVALGVRLEQFYRTWWEVFARYYTSAEQLARMFDGRSAAPAKMRHRVVFFRNRGEYEEALREVLGPNVSITAGVYIGQTRTIYCFADAEDDYSTLYHEATHQLFSETRPVIEVAGQKDNFWIIEAIACYMESLTEQENVRMLGTRETQRLLDAHYRCFESEFFVPLEDLVKMGMAEFQRDQRISMLYSQSAGLAHFLMHYDGGRYRDALISYLVAVYTGRSGAYTLAELTGTPYSELNRQYRDFLRSTREPTGGDVPSS